MIEIHDYEIKNMIRMANVARERAYVPYSKFMWAPASRQRTAPIILAAI